MVKVAKKLFTMSVVTLTILWSVGIAALVPTTVNAVDCPELEAGDLFKVPGNTAVYLLNADMERMYFPNAEVYKTWYADYSGVVEIPTTCVDAYPAPSAAPFGVNYRPGSRLVKVEISPSVYAVTPNNTKVKIGSEEVAKALYGDNWAKLVRDVADVYWPNLVNTGSEMTTAALMDGMIVKSGDTVYSVDGGKLYEVDGDLGVAKNDVRTVAASLVSAKEMASDTVTSASLVENPAQTSATGTGTGTTPVTGGAVTVSLAASSPEGASIPLAAANVEVLKFNVKAGSKAGVVDELTVKRSGTGLTTGLTAYVYDGETRVGSGKTFASDSNEAEFSVLNIEVPANTTKVLTVRIQTTSASRGNHVFSVTGMVAGGAAVSGLPVTGNLFTIASDVSAGTLTVAKNGTLSNPTVGDTNVALTQFQLTANTEDQNLYSFTLKQDGTLNTDLLSNYTLWQGSTQVHASVNVSGRYVTFVLDTPFKLVDGSAKIFTIKGDVSADSEVAKNIKFYTDRATDFNSVGLSYGFGTLATITSFDSGDEHTLTLQGGGLTISNKSQSAHDVKVDSTEVELGKVAMKAVSDNMEIQKMTVTIATVGSGDYGTFYDTNSDDNYDSGETLLLRNIKLKDADTGKTLGSAKAITDCGVTADSTDVDGTLTCEWTDYFTVKKGETRNIMLVADINSAQTSNVKYTGTFRFGTSYFTVKDSQENTVSDIVPAADIASAAVTTKTSGLTISRSATPETRTVVAGSNVDALGLIFAASAGTGNDVKVSGLTLDMYVDADVNGTFTASTEGSVNANTLVETVSIYDGSTLVAGPVGIDSNGKALFTSSKFANGYYTVTAGTNKNLIVKVQTSANAPYGGTDDAFSFTFDTDDVTAEDANGTVSATVTGTNVNGTTSPSVSVRLTGSGTITAAADSGRPEAGVLIAGLDAEQEVNRVRLTATKEAFNVSEMTVLVTSSASYDDVQYVQLYKTDGTKLGPEGGVAIDASGLAKFTDLSLNVPSTGNTVVVVKAKLSAIGERSTATNGTAGVAADSGDSIYFNLDTTDSNFRATGVSSGVVDTQADAAASNLFVVRNTKPTVAISSLASTVLSNSVRTIMKFTVAADANSDVTLGSISPYITFNDAGGSANLTMSSGTLYVYDVTGSETQLNTTGANAAVSTSAQFDIDFDTSKVVTIAAGTARTFEVRATFTGTETGDSVEARLVRDGAALSDGTETFANAIADANDDFIWSDTSADSNGVGSVEWINGYLLNLPTASSIISK